MSVVATETAWQTRHKELASWVLLRLVNRTDRYGRYGDDGAFTASGSLTEATLKNHFWRGKLAGLHSTSEAGMCKWLALDLDHHTEDPDVAASNWYDAMRICNKLTELDVRWLLEDSDGQGGLHIWVLFSDPSPAEAVHGFGCWLVGDDDHEVFPKQPGLTGKKLGNWLRLPGRHHTRDHWSRFWGGADWHDYEQSVELLLNAPANDPICLRHAPNEPETAKVGNLVGTHLDPAAPETDGKIKSIIELAEAHIDQRSWTDILTAEGWKLDSEDDGKSSWTRPGKNEGTSATLNFNGNDKIHIFSTGSNLPAGKSYGKFRFWTYSRGFDDSSQIDAAKKLLPDEVVAENDRQWRDSVDDSDVKPSEKTVDVDASNKKKIKTDHFTPFPVQLLPEVLQRFVTEAAASIGCDPTFIVMPVLGVCASAIGTSRNLCVKYGWFVPSVLWPIVIGESGTQKSPAFRLALTPLRKRQQGQIDAYKKSMAEYKSAKLKYDQQHKEWKKNQDDDEPEEPEEPARQRCIVSDVTIEALAPVLQQNPRGVLLNRDEISALIAGLDQYKKSKDSSAEVQRWLEIYNCETITIDRKTGIPPFIHVPRPAVSIAGGIQPGILQRVMTAEHRDNGFQSRFLMAFPPRQPKRWSDSQVSEKTAKAYQDLVYELFTLKPNLDPATHELKPALLKLTHDARNAFREFVNSHGREQSAMHGHQASQWSKLEEIPARLAILLHCVKQVTTRVVDHFEVDDRTMTDAITITKWFKDETLRINRLMAESDDIRHARHIAEWITGRGGEITPRDLCRNRRDIESVDDAEQLLMQLVKLGAGSWESTHKSRRFVLSQELSTSTRCTPEKNGQSSTAKK